MDLTYADYLHLDQLLALQQPRSNPVEHDEHLIELGAGLGEVFHYAVTSAEDLAKLPEAERVRKLTELRTVHDWVIRPRMRTVKGVAEINSWGGYEQQFQVRARPDKLLKFDLTLDQLVGLPVAQAPGGESGVEPEVEAELQAHQARLRAVMQARLPRSMWRAYVEACVALADGLSTSAKRVSCTEKSIHPKPA